jgi:hypothetical protein
MTTCECGYEATQEDLDELRVEGQVMDVYECTECTGRSSIAKRQRLETMDSLWEVQSLLENYVRLALDLGASPVRARAYLAKVRAFVLSQGAAR